MATAALRPSGQRKFSFSASSSQQPYDPTSSAASSSSMIAPPMPTGQLRRMDSSSADGGIGPSLLGPGGAALQTGAPTAANTIANKPAAAGSGLYGSCVVLRERLWCVPGFGDRYLNEHTSDAASSHDPVTQLFDMFRQGAPLCELYNLVNPTKPLPTDLGDSANTANACKKLVAKFIMALQNEMTFETDEMFTVMQVYRENTNDWVKVVRVISKLLDRLEEAGILIESERPVQQQDEAKPCDDRAFIVRELLESERKYVQDLEVLQNCARALQQNDILSADRLHDLFSNLNNLVDFQRRCLINIEDNARKPQEEQRFGRAFVMLEANFDVYWPFCSNYAKALEVIAVEAPNISRLRGLPAAEDCYLDPAYELPAFLIKPIQRICKYPLLLEQLLKKSDPNGPYYEELKQGLAIVQKGAAQVNEVRRTQENEQIVKDLHTRVEDWKGHNIATFGQLHLSDVFMVAKSDTEREYQVYLFEKILLCCKELVPAQGRKGSKAKGRANSIGSAKKSKTPLQLKGRIFLNNVTDAVAEQLPSSYGGVVHSLSVQWKGDSEIESFGLRCKNEEQLKQWQSAVQKLINDVERRRLNGSTSAYQSESNSPVNMAGAGANGRRATGPSGSMFPQTPISETGHMYPFARADSQMSQYDNRGGDDVTPSGRGTPMGAARFSQPAEQRERQMSLTASDSRPRARTEDQDSSILQQWRSHSPGNPPPMPRQVSHMSSSSGQDNDQTLRKASSSRQLRQASQSSQHSSSGRQGSGALSSSPYDSMPPGGGKTPTSSLRAESGVPPHMMRTYSEQGPQMMGRNRSASTSQRDHPANAGSSTPISRGGGMEQLHINTAPNGNGRQQAPSAAYSNGHLPKDKRFSGSSNSTTDSGQSGTSRPGSTAASSPFTMSGSSAGGVNGKSVSIPNRTGSQGHAARRGDSNSSSSSSAATAASNGNGSATSANGGNVIRLHIHYENEVFILLVLHSIPFETLLEKVATKVRVCTGKDLNGGQVRLKYVDEDGDRVMMHDEDDLVMALESSKERGEEVELYVV